MSSAGLETGLNWSNSLLTVRIASKSKRPVWGHFTIETLDALIWLIHLNDWNFIASKIKFVDAKACGHLGAFLVACLNTQLFKNCPESAWNASTLQFYFSLIVCSIKKKSIHILQVQKAALKCEKSPQSVQLLHHFRHMNKKARAICCYVFTVIRLNQFYNKSKENILFEQLFTDTKSNQTK